MGKALSLFIILAALLVALIACGTQTYTPPVPQDQAAILQRAQQIQSEDRAAVLGTANAIYMEGTATAEAVRATVTAQAEQQRAAIASGHATATAQAWMVQEEYRRAQATATTEAERIYATATMVAHQATATVEAARFFQAATATVGAWQAQATATAEVQHAEATATAETRQLYATATAAAVHAYATAQAAEAERAQLALERDRQVNQVKALAPWIFIALATALSIWGVARLLIAAEVRVRAVPRDARGDAPVVYFSFGNKIVAFDPDRGFGPATMLDGESVTQPQVVAPEIQERVTARDQTVDLVHRGLPGGGQRRRRVTPTQAAQMLQQPALPGPVHVVEPEQVKNWIADVEPQMLESAVEGEVLREYK